MNAAVVVTVIGEAIQFLGIAVLHAAITNQDIAAVAMNRVGPGSSSRGTATASATGNDNFNRREARGATDIRLIPSDVTIRAQDVCLGALEVLDPAAHHAGVNVDGEAARLVPETGCLQTVRGGIRPKAASLLADGTHLVRWADQH